MSVGKRPPVAYFAVALAAALAMFTYAGALVEPAAAAETHYLALWSALVLLAVAGLTVAPAYDLAALAILATLVVWAVPHGPTRGAALGLLLTVGLAVGALRALEQAGWRATWAWSVAAALGIQFLCRADRLLAVELEPRLLVGVIAAPIGAALALMALQRREETLPALLATAAAALLVPGFSVAVTLALLSLAVGLLWRHDDRPRWEVLAAAVALLAAAYAWQPSLVCLLALATLSTAMPANWKTGLLAAAAIAGLIVILPPARSWQEVVRLLSLGPLLLPALLVPAEAKRIRALQGLMLAVLALRTVAGPGALAAPLALLALSLRPRDLAAQLQLLWSGALLALGVVLAGYPWLRSPALEDTLRLFGIRVGWPAAIAAALGIWALSLLCAALSERAGRLLCRPLPVGGLVLAGLAWWALPPTAERPLGDEIQVLTAEHPALRSPVDPALFCRSIVIDTYVDNAATLEPGTPVGRLSLTGPDGERVDWQLRVGYETGEWAARRPDVAELPGFRAPPHWLAWVAPGGDVFAQRYRAEWRPVEPIEVAAIELLRSEDLPIETSLAVFHLELRR